jgi:hypothetical protein
MVHDPTFESHHLTRRAGRAPRAERRTDRALVEGVEVPRTSRPMHRIPVVYQPKIVTAGQGRKRGYLGGEIYTY